MVRSQAAEERVTLASKMMQPKYLDVNWLVRIKRCSIAFLNACTFLELQTPGQKLTFHHSAFLLKKHAASAGFEGANWQSSVLHYDVC